MLKYSVEQLIHFQCGICKFAWIISGKLPDDMTCPRCGHTWLEMEDVTDRPLIEAFTSEQLANELERRDKR